MTLLIIAKDKIQIALFTQAVLLVSVEKELGLHLYVA